MRINLPKLVKLMSGRSRPLGETGEFRHGVCAILRMEERIDDIGLVINQGLHLLRGASPEQKRG